jgi:hypothetical protein
MTHGKLMTAQCSKLLGHIQNSVSYSVRVPLIERSKSGKSRREVDNVDVEQKNSSRRWIERAKLIQSKHTVQDIQFAPHHQGLKLVFRVYKASCSADGVIRFYEAMDVMNVSNWTLTVSNSETG